MKPIVVIITLLVLFSLNAAALTNICIDTDSMKSNPENKRGYVHSTEGIFWDDCDGNILIERYCENGKPKSKEIQCAKGCSRGVCSRYTLFKSSRLQFPLMTKLEGFFSSMATNEKKVSEYEVESLDIDMINFVFRDIDRRLSLIEASLPEQSPFPIVLDANGKKLKAVLSKGNVILIDASLMLAEAVTDAEINEGEMPVNNFYKAISESNTKAITKKGKALVLVAAS